MPERELIPAAEALGLSVAAWGPLARGVSSGRFTRASGGPTGPTPHRPCPLDVVLPGDAVDELAAAVSFEVGFPSDFMARMAGFVYGDAGALVDPRGA